MQLEATKFNIEELGFSSLGLIKPTLEKAREVFKILEVVYLKEYRKVEPFSVILYVISGYK